MPYCKAIRKVFESRSNLTPIQDVRAQAEEAGFRLFTFNGQINLVTHDGSMGTSLVIQDLET